MPAVLSKSNLISFESLVTGSNGVRYTDVSGVPYMSVRDIIMVVCGQNNKRASETWQRLSEEYKNEVSAFCGNLKFAGRGQSEQPVIQLQGALKLIMWLPGNMAKDFRSKACDILTRFLAGDASLHAEIEANAQSEVPINEFARAAIPGGSGSKRNVDEISGMGDSFSQLCSSASGLEKQLVSIQRLTQAIDFDKIMRLYECEDINLDKKLRLEGTIDERAKFAADEHARSQSGKDADLVRLEKRLEIEARFKLVSAIPAPPAVDLKSVQDLASSMSDWDGLTQEDKTILVLKTGRSIVKAPYNIPYSVEKKDEMRADGLVFPVNQFAFPYHSQVTMALRDQLTKIRRERGAKPSQSQQRISVFFSP